MKCCDTSSAGLKIVGFFGGVRLVGGLSGFSQNDWYFGFVREQRGDNGLEKGMVLIVSGNWEIWGKVAKMEENGRREETFVLAWNLSRYISQGT